MKTPILLFAVLVLLAPSDAEAYLDPGTGSLVAQLFLGGIAGASVLLRLYWSKVVDLVRGRKAGKSE